MEPSIQKTIDNLSPEQRAKLRSYLSERLSGNARRAEDNRHPLSEQQKQMWFLQQLDPEDVSYNNPAAVRIVGPLDIAVLEKCFTEIVRRHSALRSSVALPEQDPVQTVNAPVPVPIAVHDLTGMSEEEKTNESLRLSEQEINRPFDLSNPLMLRVSVIRMAEEHYILIANIHHIASDGWSLGILFHELFHLYQANKTGIPSSLKEPEWQYTDYVKFQERYLESPNTEKELQFWKGKLEGIDRNPPIPTDYPRSSTTASIGKREHFEIGSEVSKQLAELGKEQGATLFMVLMSAYFCLIRMYSHNSDIAVGTPVAGRINRETQQTIGCFINTVVYRLQLSGSSTFRELLQAVKLYSFEALSHQSVPFSHVVKHLHPSRQLNQNPYYQTMLVMNNAPLEHINLPGLKVEHFDIYPGRSKVDWLLSIAELSSGLKGFLVYNSALYKKETIEQVTAVYSRILAKAASHPETTLEQLANLMPADARPAKAAPQKFVRKSAYSLIEGR
ncbi:condensation domain-containing protein [Paenibacillus sp. GCM10027627]|uniref:condensation domain-containing protein n=1 Tax=unclassified Paenibacillus TaxID=185978 RepID=UPI003629F4D2